MHTEFEKNCRDVLYLVICAANRRTPEKARVEKMDLEAVYRIAKRHLVRAAAAIAVQAAGVKDKRLNDGYAASLRKTILFDGERKKVIGELEKAGIWYLPLKGMILKEYYPKTGMREMSDHDILIDAARADDVKKIMESLGFRAEHFGSGNHDVYHKEPVFNFEMHTSLFSSIFDERIAKYYETVKSRLIKDEDSAFGYHYTKEDFYIYITAHEYKHFSGGGTGIRSLMDIYLYLSKESLNMEYVAGELEKLGIADFEKQNRSLALHLFGGEKLSEEEERMLRYILGSGAYGTIENRIDHQIRKQGGSKIAYAWKRFGVPFSNKNPYYKTYAGRYPFFYKHKIFLPLLPVYRLFRSFGNGRFKAEMRAIKRAKNTKGQTGK